MITDRLQRLSPRELEVLALIAEGWSNLYIRKKLLIEKKTLGTHMVNIYNKLEVTGTKMKARHPRVTASLMYFRRPVDIVNSFPNAEDLQQWEYKEG